MNTPNTKDDILNLPAEERDKWMARLAASIPIRSEDGTVSEDVGTITRFGFVRGDFPAELPPPPLTVPPDDEEAVPDAPVIEAPDPIPLGEAWVRAAGLSAARLVTLMDLLLQTKEADALASKPKLTALYTWLQTVKGMAIAGSVAFPPAPHTFEEVISE